MFTTITSTSDHTSFSYVYIDELTDMEYTTIYVLNTIEEL
jgi:hypothetical protein